MKLFLISILIISTVYGFDILNHETQEFAEKRNICAGVADGIRLPDDSDCNLFTLCDDGRGLPLRCRSTEPHFNRCTSSCVNDPSVCQIRDCSGSPTTTTPGPPAPTTTPLTTTTPRVTAPPAPTEAPTTVTAQPPPAPTEGPTTTTTQPPTNPPTNPPTQPPTNPPTQPLPTTTTPTTTTTTPTTTTPFIPTVGLTCNPPCNAANYPGLCGCPERYRCVNRLCTCDNTIHCPFDRSLCTSSCGCVENCNCNLPNNQCTCHSEPCRCHDQRNCPFPSSQCTSVCGCQQRCLCNGNVCTCDPNVSCSRVKNYFFNY